jgi:hypothetical protein
MGLEKQEENIFLGSISFFWIWSISAILFLNLVPLINFIFRFGSSKWMTKHLFDTTASVCHVTRAATSVFVYHIIIF